MKTFTIGWLNKCRCGNKSHSVKTARGNESALWDDDAVKCNSCGRGGVIQVCEGQARVLWETNEEMAEGKPMSTITKERIANLLQFNSEGSNCQANAEQWEVHELARIALASLEAEPAIHRWRRVTSEPYGPYPWHYGDFIGFSKPVDGIEDEYFYTAPPAPVSVPDAMEMDDDFDSAFEHGKAVGWNAYRAAMLQGAEPVTTDYKLPFDQWLSQQTGTIDVECGCVMTEVFFHWLRVAYDAGNSPVIADGWVILPAEPTQAMMNAWLSEVANWRGHAAGYRAMIAAAPQQEA